MKTGQVKRLFFFALLLVFLLIGCSQPDTPQTIDVIVRFRNTDFWKSMFEGAEVAASRHGVQVHIYGSDLNESTSEQEQVELVLESIERRPDAILLSPRDYEMLAEPVEKAHEAGIPVILMDSAIKGDTWISLVATNNEAAGQRLAEELLARLGTDTKGKVGIINFIATAQNAQTREAGLRNHLADSPSLEILETIYNHMDVNVAYTEALRMIEENPDLKAIAAFHVTAAAGIGRALKETGRKDIVFVSFDCTSEMAQFIEDGILDVAILQQPYLMGYYALDRAVAYLEGNEIDRYVYTETHVVNRENLFTKESQQIIFPF